MNLRFSSWTASRTNTALRSRVTATWWHMMRVFLTVDVSGRFSAGYHPLFVSVLVTSNHSSGTKSQSWLSLKRTLDSYWAVWKYSTLVGSNVQSHCPYVPRILNWSARKVAFPYSPLPYSPFGQTPPLLFPLVRKVFRQPVVRHIAHSRCIHNISFSIRHPLRRTYALPR